MLYKVGTIMGEFTILEDWISKGEENKYIFENELATSCKNGVLFSNIKIAFPLRL
jgi:hypothetical protein